MVEPGGSGVPGVREVPFVTSAARRGIRHVGGLFGPPCVQFFRYLVIVQRDDGSRHQAGILRPGCSDGEGSNGNAARHLHRGQQRIKTLQWAAVDWHANNRALSVSGYRSGQMCGHARGANKYTASSFFGILHIGLSTRRRPMGTRYLYFKLDTQRLEHRRR